MSYRSVRFVWTHLHFRWTTLLQVVFPLPSLPAHYYTSTLACLVTGVLGSSWLDVPPLFKHWHIPIAICCDKFTDTKSFQAITLCTSACSHQGMLYCLALWREEYVYFHLSSSHRNAKIYQQLAQQMQEKGYSWDISQCCAKASSWFRITKNAKGKNKTSLNAPITCVCYEELDWIFAFWKRPPQNSGICRHPSHGL